MSGAAKLPATRATPGLRLPRVGERFDSALVNNAFNQLERADAGNVKVGQQTTFPSIMLLSPSNIAWELTVSDTGEISVAQAPPTRPY